MTIDEMRQRKAELGYTNEMLAQKTGVPLGTVQKIFAGVTKAPRKRTLDALAEALRPPVWNPLDEEILWTGVLRESPAPYTSGSKRRREFTAEDYYAMTDDRRCELIDGQIYDMSSPSRLHQGVLGDIYVQLYECVSRHEGQCFLYLAPSDVQLGEKTVVQPDLYIHCHPENESPEPLRTAPDFIIEVTSPSTLQHDLLRKHYLYQKCGVREYWIVDPRKKKVVVFDLEHEELPDSYTFEDVVPVKISQGECAIDFRRVFKRVSHLYDAS